MTIHPALVCYSRGCTCHKPYLIIEVRVVVHRAYSSNFAPRILQQRNKQPQKHTFEHPLSLANLSSYTYVFSSTPCFCHSVHFGVFLKRSVIPHLKVYVDKSSTRRPQLPIPHSLPRLIVSNGPDNDIYSTDVQT